MAQRISSLPGSPQLKERPHPTVTAVREWALSLLLGAGGCGWTSPPDGPFCSEKECFEACEAYRKDCIQKATTAFVAVPLNASLFAFCNLGYEDCLNDCNAGVGVNPDGDACEDPADQSTGPTEGGGMTHNSTGEDVPDTTGGQPTTSTTDATTSTTDATTSTTDATTSTTDGPASTTDATTSTTGPAPVCGDGNVDPGEACDDGANNGPGQFCNAECQDNVCGDEDKSPCEGCDGGPNCKALCLLGSCGNGVVDPGEACDDGNAKDDDGCTNRCTTQLCPEGLDNQPPDLEK